MQPEITTFDDVSYESTWTDYVKTEAFMRLVDIDRATLKLWIRCGFVQAQGDVITLAQFVSLTELQVQIASLRHAYQQWLTHRSRLEHCRILVVEDDVALSQLYQMQLEKISPNDWVSFASDGYQALVNIGAVKPDILICDLRMPGMDGFHLLDVLSSEPALESCAKIVISGLTKSELNARFPLPESVTLLAKPVQFELLRAVIRNVKQRQSELEYSE